MKLYTRVGHIIKWLFSGFRLLAFFVLALTVLAFFFFAKKTPNYSSVLVKRGDVVRDISVTGKVVSIKEANLGFERAGRVEYIASSGESVVAGDVIGRLDINNYEALLKEARGILDLREAELNQLLAGAKPQEIRVLEVDAEVAKRTLDLSTNELKSTVLDTSRILEDIINVQINGLFNVSNNPATLLFSLNNDLSLQASIESEKNNLDTTLSSWLMLYGDASKIEKDPLTSANKLIAMGEKLRVLLDSLNIALSSQYIGNIDASAWKSKIVLMRASASTNIDKLRTITDKNIALKGAFDLKNSQLNVKKSSPDIYEIAIKKAQIKSAEGRVEAIIADMEKGVIKSPINGVISKSLINIGETTQGGVAVISVISDDDFYIEVNIPESDIAEVDEGSLVSITLDAYKKDLVLKGKVIAVEPGENVVSGVPTYKATIALLDKYKNLKTGMTANLEIEGERRNDVLTIPTRAIIADGSKRFVEVLDKNNNLQKIEVNLGIRGTNGVYEIKSGLSEGDAVIISSQVNK